ncbi:hypothetical protein B0H65DRAFT_206204 [Neurospora tetraspora]|uniref:Uncharacterized protein n=1 Tax=Neurospora tetraspora TaxID=94610 RepID=A0AAE0MSN3_9PEZI|nr:hypothetical protein B0H65DRAFT_206204 [Neurospora tetraspora]
MTRERGNSKFGNIGEDRCPRYEIWQVWSCRLSFIRQQHRRRLRSSSSCCTVIVAEVPGRANSITSSCPAASQTQSNSQCHGNRNPSLAFGERSDREPSEACHPEWRHGANWMQARRWSRNGLVKLSHVHPELVHLF